MKFFFRSSKKHFPVSSIENLLAISCMHVFGDYVTKKT